MGLKPGKCRRPEIARSHFGCLDQAIGEHDDSRGKGKAAEDGG
jgi:hypothetical protein